MVPKIENLLSNLRGCFSRQEAFDWFLIIILGFIVRYDHFGVSSFVRWLFLSGGSYENIINFFRATSWDLNILLGCWARLALQHYPLIKINGRTVIIGDGIKVSKEAKKMPGVKTLHQESENSGKAEYIRGHYFNFIGLLVGYFSKSFCLPIQGRLHDGVGSFRPGEAFDKKPATIISRMAYLIVNTVNQMGGCLSYVVLDAYYSTRTVFLILKSATNDKGEQLVHVITRAKDNYVAYFDPKNGGKKFQDGDKFHLYDLFSCPGLFLDFDLIISGKMKTIKYCCGNYLWKPIGDLVSFVFIMDGDDRYILMCSDLVICPTQIITIYCYRSKIETMFLLLKHLIGGFSYRFWTKIFPKLNRGEDFEDYKPDANEKNKLEATTEAIERFVNLAGIALGVLQYLALTCATEIWSSHQGWLRTYSSKIPSEGIVQNVIRGEFFFSSQKVPVCRTLRMILQRSRSSPVQLAA